MPDRMPPGAAGYLLKEAGLFVAFCYLLLIASTSNGVVNYELTRLSLGLLGAVVVGWSAFRLWQAPRPATSAGAMPLNGPVALFLAVYLLAAVASTDARRSLGDAWLVGAYVLVFALTADLVTRGWPRELFAKALLLCGGLILGLGWYSVFGWYRQWLAAAPGEWLPSIVYRLPSPNTLVIFLNLLLMTAVARFWVTRALAPRVLLAVWIVAALGLIFLTSSRGGWLGMSAGGSLAVALSLRGTASGGQVRKWWVAVRQRRALVLVGLGAGAAAVILIGWAASRELAHPTHSPLLESRGYFWEPAWQAFLHAPWLGQGPFTYGSAFLRAHSVPPDTLYVHAHSVFFNLLSETGMIGLAAFGVLVAAALRALWQQLAELDGEDRAVAVGASAALAAYAVHGLFETVSAEPTNDFVVAILLGAALAPGARAALPRPRLLHRWPMALGIVVVATGMYGIWLSTPLHLGVVAANQKQWAAAADYLAEAARRDPRSAVVHQQLGLANSLLAAQGVAGALPRAIAAFEAAVRLDPDWALNHANLGALYAANGDATEALRELRAATELAPGAALYHLNLGAIAESAGDTSVARRAYAEVLRLRPDWAEAYFWRATTLRSEVLADWRASAPPLSTPTLAELEAAVARQPQSALTYAQLAQAYLDAGRQAEAAAALRKAGLAYGQREADALEVLWARAELAAAQRNWREAAALGEQALDGYRLQSVFGPGTFGSPVYGGALFRRETMAVDLVPQLAVILLTDPWATRMVQLGEWYEAQGDPARAATVYREVLGYVPDQAAARARLP